MTEPSRILIVEDDLAIATGLAMNLKLAGYDSAMAGDGEAALRQVRDRPPDLILLDLGLPGMDGLSVLSELRQRGDATPVIVLSAREGEYDKVAALRLGADDYVTKPFALAELMARVDAVLRRFRQAPNHRQRPATQRGFGSVVIDSTTRTVSRDGEPVKLTHLEFELLRFFLQNQSQVYSRGDLLQKVWGQHSGSPRTVDNFVGQLRQKLERDPDNPVHFVTIRGSGYRFDP